MRLVKEKTFIPFLVDEKPNVLPGAIGLHWQGYSAVRWSGINRLYEPGSAAGRGSAGPDG